MAGSKTIQFLTSASVFTNYRWYLLAVLYTYPAPATLLSGFSSARWEKSIERLRPVSHRPWHFGSNSGPHFLKTSTLAIKVLILTRALAFS